MTGPPNKKTKKKYLYTATGAVRARAPAIPSHSLHLQVRVATQMTVSTCHKINMFAMKKSGADSAVKTASLVDGKMQILCDGEMLYTYTHAYSVRNGALRPTGGDHEQQWRRKDDDAQRAHTP
jgi:hypothetical protein